MLQTGNIGNSKQPTFPELKFHINVEKSREMCELLLFLLLSFERKFMELILSCSILLLLRWCEWNDGNFYQCQCAPMFTGIFSSESTAERKFQLQKNNLSTYWKWSILIGYVWNENCLAEKQKSNLLFPKY